MTEIPSAKKLADDGVIARTTTSPAKWIRLFKLDKKESACRLNLRIHNTTTSTGVVSIVTTDNNVVGGPVTPEDDQVVLPILPNANLFLVVDIVEFLEFETPVDSKALIEHYQLVLNPGWSLYICSDIRHVNFELSSI